MLGHSYIRHVIPGAAASEEYLRITLRKPGCPVRGCNGVWKYAPTRALLFQTETEMCLWITIFLAINTFVRRFPGQSGRRRFLVYSLRSLPYGR